MEVPLDEMQDHNCVQDLRHTLMAIIYDMKGKLSACEAELERLRDSRHTTPITVSENQAGVSGAVFAPPSTSRDVTSNPHNLSDEEIR